MSWNFLFLSWARLFLPKDPKENRLYDTQFWKYTNTKLLLYLSLLNFLNQKDNIGVLCNIECVLCAIVCITWSTLLSFEGGSKISFLYRNDTSKTWSKKTKRWHTKYCTMMYKMTSFPCRCFKTKKDNPLFQKYQLYLFTQFGVYEYSVL